MCVDVQDNVRDHQGIKIQVVPRIALVQVQHVFTSASVSVLKHNTTRTQDFKIGVWRGADVDIRTHRDTVGLYQRYCRAAMAAKALEATETIQSGAADPRKEWIDRQLVGNIIRRLENFVNSELELYIGSRTCNSVMEKLDLLVFAHTCRIIICLLQKCVSITESSRTLREVYTL